jgi:heptosyltransferase-3
MRILFITSTYLGDAILSTGILNNLQKTYPQAIFYIACGSAPAPLFEALPNRAETYIIQKKPFSFHWVQLWFKCILKKWDLVVDMRGTCLSYVLWVSRRKVWKASPSSTLRVHQIAQWFGLAVTPPNIIWTTSQNQKEADIFLPNGPSYIAFSPTANWDKKCWPLDYFIQLGKLLLKDKKNFPNAKIVILGTSGQRSQVESLFQAFKKEEIIDLMGKPSLPTLSLCLSQCKIFIGNDSGLMHLAAASSVPTVGLFGPSPSHIYGPWGQNTTFISLPDSQELIFQRLKKGTEVMREISVEAVYSTVQNRIKKVI